MLEKPKEIQIGIGVAIFNNNKELLLEKRSDNGLLGFPGGGLIFGEDLITCARREVKEETGLYLRSCSLIGVYSNPENTIVEYPERFLQKVDVFVLGVVTPGKLQKSSESLDLQYFNMMGLSIDIIDNNAKRPLLDLMYNYTGVIS